MSSCCVSCVRKQAWGTYRIPTKWVYRRWGIVLVYTSLFDVDSVVMDRWLTKEDVGYQSPVDEWRWRRSNRSGGLHMHPHASLSITSISIYMKTILSFVNALPASTHPWSFLLRALLLLMYGIVIPAVTPVPISIGPRSLSYGTISERWRWLYMVIRRSIFDLSVWVRWRVCLLGIMIEEGNRNGSKDFLSPWIDGGSVCQTTSSSESGAIVPIPRLRLSRLEPRRRMGSGNFWIGSL